ncbi:MAG TPA: beta-propeller fold lactonase family protein [Pyrinomonadaceae bacterium]
MSNGKLVCAFNFILIAALAVAAQFGPTRSNLHSGAVYVMTNQTANAVMAFSRNPRTGELTLVDTEPTQGAGDPIPIPPDPPIDPLASQGAIIVDEDNQFVYAVNAGSNEISVFQVNRTDLDFIQKIASGGIRPISLTIWNGWLYVLNEGGTPNITGFRVADNGTLTPIPNSTQPLIGGASADPAQVGFSPDGTLLVVTEKAGNRLDTYVVGTDGVAGPPMANPSAGMTPFGFAFSSAGFLFVSEAFGGMPMMGAVSSYERGDGDLDVITANVRNGGTATCWLQVTNNGRFIYVSNTGSDTLSSYVADETGELSLLMAVAANTGAMSAPVDIALSVNSHFLYVLENGSHTVSAWRIGRRGDLELIGEFGTIPPGAQGIAAK